MSLLDALVLPLVSAPFLHLLVDINLRAWFGKESLHIFPKKSPQRPEKEQQEQQKKQRVQQRQVNARALKVVQDIIPLKLGGLENHGRGPGAAYLIRKQKIVDALPGQLKAVGRQAAVVYYGKLEAGDLRAQAVAHLLHALALLGLLPLGSLRALVLLAQYRALPGNTGQKELGVRIAAGAALFLVLLYYAQPLLGLFRFLGDDLHLDIGEDEGFSRAEDGVQDLVLDLGFHLPARGILPLHDGSVHAAGGAVRGVGG